MIWKIAALAWVGMSVSAAAVAQSNTVWRVGTFDGSSGEFAEGEPHGQVIFQAGQDNPSKSWYAYAPVAFAGNPAEGASALRTIAFAIAGTPDRSYHFKASIMIEQSSVLALRMGINGKTGLFYLHPKLDYKMGDMVAAFYPAYSRAEVEFDFPGAWLKQGKNAISLQAVRWPKRKFRMRALPTTPSS